MAKAKKHKWTAEEVIALLRERYGKTGQGGNSNRYVFLEQVAPATGFSRMATWIDAMSISMWPSDGLHREAFEVKVSRRDFLNEINDPMKNQWFRAHCTMFWYVAAPGVVASADEIPEGCGWMEAQKGRLVTKKQATSKEQDKTVTADFFAAIARAMENEFNRRRREVETELLSRPANKLAFDSVRFIEAWLAKQGIKNKGGYSSQWEDVEELEKMLNDARTGVGDAHLADHIDHKLHDLRDAVGNTLLELLPYAAHLLHEADDLGHFVNKYMSRGNYDMLSDVRQREKMFGRRRPETPQQRKERKAKLALFEELLGLRQEAEEEATS